MNDLVEVAVDAPELPSSNQMLAERARDGCAAAFNELVRRYRPRLMQFLEKRLSGRRVEAEDVTQEAIAKAWSSIAKYDARFQFSTWLYTIATRVCTDHLRRPQHTVSSATLDQLPNQSAGFNDPLEQQEAAENIWSTAQRVLSEEQYSVLWLRYGEDLAIREIARILGKTGVGVRVALHRARTVLKPVLTSETNSTGTHASSSNTNHRGAQEEQLLPRSSTQLSARGVDS